MESMPRGWLAGSRKERSGLSQTGEAAGVAFAARSHSRVDRTVSSSCSRWNSHQPSNASPEAIINSESIFLLFIRSSVRESLPVPHPVIPGIPVSEFNAQPRFRRAFWVSRDEGEHIAGPQLLRDPIEMPDEILGSGGDARIPSTFLRETPEQAEILVGIVRVR